MSTDAKQPKPAPARIYIVFNGGGPKPRMIRAQNQAQVIQHIAKGFEIRVASVDDAIEARDMGVQIEDAKEEVLSVSASPPNPADPAFLNVSLAEPLFGDNQS